MYICTCICIYCIRIWTYNPYENTTFDKKDLHEVLTRTPGQADVVFSARSAFVC